MVPPKRDFASKDVQSWDDLIEAIKHFMEGRWLYRGQAHDWPSQSTLERHIDSWALKQNHAPALEAALAREFRRRVRGEEQPFIQDDMLYCLALMRHHGAPTRLLDCTYSPFVAAQTALREGLNRKQRPVIWCFSTEWKLYLHFDNIKKQVDAVMRLKRMNVSSTVLFPGLDGFARSLGEELPFYDEIYGLRT